jgi:hypothetical protein
MSILPPYSVQLVLALALISSLGCKDRNKDLAGTESAVVAPRDSGPTVVIGSNTWAGGTNQVNFSLSPSSPGTSVSIDGKVLIQEGKLLIPGEVANR